MTARRIGVFSLAMFAAACTVGPDYERPPVMMPEKWRDAAAKQGPSIANVAWWDLFKDEQLRKLIKIALEENRDLKIAVERIEEARANYGISKADFYPKVDANITAGALNPSDGSLTHAPDSRDTTGLFNASLGFSWELDFFGRIRRATEAQRALLLGTEEARRAVAITLVSQVALTYMDLRGLDNRLAIAQHTLISRRENVEFSRMRFEGAVTHEVDMRQAEAELHRVESMAFDLEKLVAQKENELSFLLGRNPASIVRSSAKDFQPIPPQVPADLPAALLQRRPDVRKAELDLMSATARVGEATAMMYPRISLTGSYGLASTDLGELIDPSSQSWHLFTNLLQPIFNAGANQARVEVKESQQRQAIYTYEKTLLQALREVEDSLVALRLIGRQRTAQTARGVAQRKVLELSELRYKGGVANYLEVLDAQRSLFDAEIDEAIAATEHSKSLVSLYKALGGGWPAPDKSGKQAPTNQAPGNKASLKPVQPAASKSANATTVKNPG